jgi:hypothetical protein
MVCQGQGQDAAQPLLMAVSAGCYQYFTDVYSHLIRCEIDNCYESSRINYAGK